jgi:hypothetical protein
MPPLIRELPQDEWYRLEGIGPFASAGVPEPSDNWRLIVAEDAGEIVGVCGLFTAVHWDPWWVKATYQGNPAVFGGLVEAGLQTLHDLGIDTVHTTVPHDQPMLKAMLERFGYTGAPGQLYILYVPNAIIQVKG